MATMIYGTLNLDTWILEFARAGHPYPLLICPDGNSLFLTEAAGPPLGTGGTFRYETQAVKLDPGETLLFYTDGLIERRGDQLSQGEAALRTAAASAPQDVQEKCSSIIQQLTEGTEIVDDIATLLVQAVGLDERLEIEAPAVADELAGIRHLLRRWVTVNGGTDDDCAAVAIAVTEACANAVEHAYGPGDETIEVNAELEGDTVTITVSDRGGWREPRGENRGRGILVMKEFMDDVKIDSGDAGTTVELRRRIGSPPR